MALQLWGGVLVSALALLIALWLTRPPRLFLGGKVRIPKHFEVAAFTAEPVPPDAIEPVRFLEQKLQRLGFSPAEGPVRAPALEGFGKKLLLITFSHLDERALFLLAIEADFGRRASLMLHIITPLTEQRRVETSTLAPLLLLATPPRVEAQVVLDADSVDEIWSRHRRALLHYGRDERLPVQPQAWQTLAAEAYEGWLQSAIRAHRLQLEPNGTMYKIRGRPRSVV